MTGPQPRFAICIDAGVDTELTSGRVYRILDDPKGKPHGLIRVFDNSGEDYLYPAEDFVEIAVPADATDAVVAALAS